MIEGKSLSEEYDRLSKNSGDEAYKTVDAALKQIRSYLAGLPGNTNERDMRVIATLGKEVGKAADALEQRVLALQHAGYFK